MEAVDEPPLRKRKVEEITVSHDVVSSGFISEEEWSAAVNNDPPSGWTDEDDDDVVTDLEQELYRQIRESDVEIHIFPDLNLFMCDFDNILVRNDCGSTYVFRVVFFMCTNVLTMITIVMLTLLAFALEWDSIGTTFTRFCALMTYHITAEAVDPDNDLRFTFQTCVTQATCKNDEDLRILTEVCRIKPKIQGTGDKPKRWNGEAIDDFYKGNLPKWISDDALMPCSEQDQFYEVQESEIREHNWLNLYTEIALYSLWEGDMRLGSCVPLQIMKVIVETREAVESKEKLMAGNAIFYISFRYLNAPHGPPQDHRAIVRRTVDGIPGHVSLVFKCWLQDL
ncbi:hypothetical protein ARALYDRAFT_913543 [Arabidopsis lyrata subsp. lyrata]|uniref:Uncharacterized protein n=1 Tax=Arabidopsis lyrata subsp. lyrata TaxID=81972 RepID=D7MCK4_ARALL|nr:hypothetical protein ARALYDRAFT_913543 [Arabidopsis lyrata subsp. lyrata]